LIRPPRVDSDLHERFRREGHWRGETLHDAFGAHVRARPDDMAVVDAHRRLTYAELDRAAAGFAGALRAVGVVPGDVVSVQLPNRAEFLVAHLAIERLGAVINPLLPQYREHELIDMQRKLEATVAIFPESFHGHRYRTTWDAVRAASGFPPQFVTLSGGATDRRDDDCDFWTLTTGAQPVQAANESTGGDDVIIVQFTSGTVAAKGVMHTHDTTVYGLREYTKLLGLDERTVLWMPSPISHATGLQWGVRTALYLGCTLVLQEQWDPEEALDLIQREQCTMTIGAASFVHDLRIAGRRRPEALRTLQSFVCAGAPVPEELILGARKELGVEVLRAYGMTEHYISTQCVPDDPDDKRLRTDGRPFPGTETTVFDDERRAELGVGMVGELAVRGPGVALGYLCDPERTAETFRDDGWQFTEDLAVIDAEGYVQLVGRKKDLIVRGGMNISPTEIEGLLLEHPAVADIAVVGVPEERLGERICAVVVPAPGAEPTLDDLKRHLLDRGVSKLKLPESIVLRTLLPRTPSGKVRKNVLRDDVVADQRAG
jgi:acyl-coenzyme A synthetase/AMP-(fatty) acid ligase